MNLKSFAFNQFERINYVNELCGTNKTPNEILDELEQIFDQGKVVFTRKGEIVSEDKATQAWFRTNYLCQNGDPIILKYERNTRNDQRKWYLIEPYNEEEMYSEQINSNFVSIGEIIFNDNAELLRFLEKLANEVQKEEWKYKEYKSAINYPILKSYIEHSYFRLKREGKVLFSTDKRKIMFNTGLLERNFLLDVYISCNLKKVKVLDKEMELPYKPEILCEDDINISKQFGVVVPELAKYFKKIDEVVFNPDLEINMNWKHIFIERADRIPKDIAGNTNDIKDIVQKFRGNEENLKKIARRNYKMVVPQYYKENIQFLMPVYLGSELSGTPDFALVLDIDKENLRYNGTTILTIEMAYQNARLLAKPDSPWIISKISQV